MYTFLCDLCSTTAQLSQHNNWIGYVGFAIVVVMIIQDQYRKNKAKKNKEN